MEPKEIFKKEHIIKWLQRLQLIFPKIQPDYLHGIFKKDFIVGLDIGTSSIKLAQFTKKEDGLHLVKADLKEIKQFEDSTLREQEIVSALKDLIRGIDIKKSKFIVSINCPKTAIRRIIVPYMPRSELADGIRLEAKNYFPFPIEEAELDFEIVGDVIEKGVKKYQVIIATSPQKTINGYLSLLEKLGIKPASFVSAPYALQKLTEVSLFKEGSTLCFIDIGSRYTELAIFKDKNLIFSRKIPVAGDDFTKAMTGVLASDRGRTELTLEEAERLKRQVGIPPESESKMIDDKISTMQILSMLRTPLEQLISEIDRCFDYYREETAGGKIDSLILFGAGASLKGLPGFLSKELGIEVKMGDSLAGLKIESMAKDERDKLALQLGLAIGAALSEAKGINLLPAEIKEETKRTFKRSGIEAVTVGVILALVLIYIGMKIQLNNFQKRISVAKMELSSLHPQLKQVEICGLLADEPYWEEVFKDLSNIIPPESYLTEFTMQNKTIKMRGIVTSKEPEESLSNFILNLEKGIFKNVKLVTSKRIKEKSANEFEINCWID